MQNRIFITGSLSMNPRVVVATTREAALASLGLVMGTADYANALDITDSLMDNIKEVVPVLLRETKGIMEEKSSVQDDKVVPFPKPASRPIPTLTGRIPTVPFDLPKDAKLIAGGSIDVSGMTSEEIIKAVKNAVKGLVSDDAEIEITHYDLNGNQISAPDEFAQNSFVPEISKVEKPVETAKEPTVETTSTETEAKYTDKIQVSSSKFCPAEWRAKTLRIFYSDRLGTSGEVVTSNPAEVWESLTKYDFYTITDVQVRIA